MEREDIEEFARNSGVGPSHPALAMREADMLALERFAKLVEQATLERAAKHFEERCVFEMANGNHFAKEIRALKTENSV